MLLFALCAVPVAPAAQQPALERRAAHAADPAPSAATGRTDLPPEAEGEYPWGRLGEEIELYFEHGRLQGYMTQRSEAGNDRSAPMTFDFASTHAEGHALQWTTRVVHGVFYSFTGSLERGPVATPAQPGFYVLSGTLTTHGGALDSVSRVVRSKREPGGS